MKSSKIAFMLLGMVFICVVCSTTFTASDPTLTVEERAKAIKLLKDSEQETLDALEKLSDEQLKFKAAPDRWSILEVAEHIVLAEGLLFAQVDKALAGQPNPEWETKTKSKTAFVEKAVVNRQVKVKAPEEIVPTGKLSRAEIIAKYKEARGKTLKFAEETQIPLKSYTLDHPFPIFGTLNAYQWLIYIPLHNMRHNLQIAEVKADPNFPK
ncbi:MAG: DinB family protein [Blastocatellia bacterium]|nr:DinB family protein [Blastocatellia bacterium]